MLNSSSRVKDLRGVEAKVTDIIVVGLRHGDSAETRIGIIVNFLSKKRPYGSDLNHYVEVDWSFTSAYSLPDKGITRLAIDPHKNNKFVVVELPSI